MKLSFLCTADLWRNLVVSVLLFLLMVSYSIAQVGEPDVAELRKELEQVKTTADLTDTVRAMAEKALKQAIEQVELIEQWRSKAEEFATARKQAPAMLKKLAAELDSPLVEVALTVPDGVTLSDMEQLLEQAESDLEVARNTAAQLDAEKLRRAGRRLELPKLLTDAGIRLNEAEEALRDTPPSDQAPALGSALKALNLARAAAIQQEKQALQSELASYEARGGLLKDRLQMADRQIAKGERLVAFWNQRVHEERSREAEAATLEAEREIARVHPALRELATQNASLAKARIELSQNIEQTRTRVSAIDKRLIRLQEDFQKIDERVAAAGLTNAIGQFLRKQRTDLPNVHELRKKIRLRQGRIGDVQVQIIGYEEQRETLSDPGVAIDSILAGIGKETSPAELGRITAKARELIKIERTYLDELVTDLGSYFKELVDLDSIERQLLERAEFYNNYIDENVLWIASGPSVVPGDLIKAGQAGFWLANVEGWQGILRSVWGTLRASPLITLGMFTLLAILFFTRHRLHRLMLAKASEDPLVTPGTISELLLPLVYTLLYAISLPALAWFLAWLLASPFESTDFAKAIAAGLRSAALLYFSLDVFKRLCEDKGFGARHFKWQADIRRPIAAGLSWLKWIIVPAGFIAGVMDFQLSDSYRESLGRIVFILAFMALALFLQRLVNPKGQVIRLLLSSESRISLRQVRYLWHPMAIGAPLALALASALGYYYTAHYLSWRLLETIWVLLAVALLNLIVNRWLQLRIQQRALKEAKQQTMDAQAERVDGDGMVVPVDDLEMEDAEIGAQATKLVRTLVFGTLLVGLWWIWAEVLPALAIFDKVTLWNNTVEIAQTVTQPDGTSAISKYVDVVPVTLADLGLAIIILVLTIFASRNIPGLMEITILQRLPMTPGGSYAFTAITTYIITGVGLVLSFSAIGIGWAKVQWLVAAMTVGIGFGMKEIITNFISGLIILFERPIRVGDVVTVGNVSGVVSRIRIRATVITDFDRKELIVPNQRFITDEVLNWTLSDSIIRVVFPVSVSNRSDVTQIRELLLNLSMVHPMVLPDPEPSVVFNGFGPGSLLFNLRVFIRREDYAKVLDSVNTAIQLKLSEAGVEIATDRQEIQVRPAVEEQSRFVSPFEARGKKPPEESD